MARVNPKGFTERHQGAGIYKVWRVAAKEPLRVGRIYGTMTDSYMWLCQQGAPGQSPLGGILPILVVFMVFYFFVIRPQGKRRKEHEEMLARLKKGDTVATNGGVIGSIFAVTPTEVTLEVADKTKIRVLRAQIAGIYSPASAGSNEEKS